MALSHESQGLFEAQGLKVHYTGVGKVKATFTAAQMLEKSKPDWVLNLGTAGSKKIKVGELVEVTQFVQRDPLYLEFPQKIFHADPITQFKNVSCGTADFVEYGEPQIDCEIFDMEAYALAYVCDQKKIKFNSIKYISDSSDENVVREWKANLKAASEALLSSYLHLRAQKNLLLL